MVEKNSNNSYISDYPANCVINYHQIIRILIVFFVAIIFTTLLIGVGKTLVLIGIIVAFCVVVHTLLKLSAIFRPWSKIKAKFDPKYKPLVSIHIACKNERAETVIATIKAIQKLDYPSFEVIVINNNNQDRQNWSKIQKYIKNCGKRYKFVHLDRISGYKAGALNYVNARLMDKDAKIEAIVDCDYLVTPDFLNKTVGYFSDPKIGIVQAPQNYYNVNKYNIGLFYEFRSFFTIVMHQAQRLNLVTSTGTMGLFRTDLLKLGLTWNEWCITEDVEAGTHINSIGYRGVYVDKSLGKGLMPYDYISMVKQRQRWTYGNMQIIYKDISHVIVNKGLSFSQKLAFVTQLASWFHFELVIAGIYLISNIIQLFGYSGSYFNFTSNLMLALLAFSVICHLIYFIVGIRQDTSLINRFKAFIAHYGLLYIMSSSWLSSFFGRRLGFVVTKKEKTGNKIPFEQYSQEFIIPIIFLAGLLLRINKGNGTMIDLIVITIFIIIELSGIFYLRRAFIESNKLDGE